MVKLISLDSRLLPDYTYCMTHLHQIQMKILRELLFHPKSRFTDLNISGLSSDHFSYHIRELKKLGLVDKVEDTYILSHDGKEFANRMDTDKNIMEKQPKVSVVICPELEINGVKHYAVQTRLKEPYYGYNGFITGKVRFGEKIVEAAARELLEEMGITATFAPMYVLHEMVYDMSGNMLEDKFFHAVLATNVKGKLVTEIEGGKNRWVTKKEFEEMAPKYHNEDDIFAWFDARKYEFIEETYFIESF